MKSRRAFIRHCRKALKLPRAVPDRDVPRIAVAAIFAAIGRYDPVGGGQCLGVAQLAAREQERHGR